MKFQQCTTGSFLNRAIIGGLIAVVTSTSASALLLGRDSDKAQETLSQYERTGDTVSCISLRRIKDTDALDDYTMLVEVSGGGMYLNELSGRCIGFGREQRYLHKSSQAQMCRGDIIHVLDSFGNQRGSCGLGDFEKLTKIENPES